MRLTAKTSPILGTNPKTRTLHIMLQFCRTARQMLANSQHILIVHTKKEANCVAHRLSRLAFTTSERYWMEDVSSQLSFDVQHDLGTIFVPERQYPTVIEELCHKFSLADLRKSTNNFHHKRRIERGGFGIVYKVFLQRDNGSYYTVEIKRIYEEVFRNEIELLCQLRHPNLVSLIGFCNDLNEKIIVYEYMSNGSLHQLLQSGILSWKKRLELCIGAARGLHYLHAGAKRTIIHRHIKPSNILLDDNMEPKLAGFDLSIQGAHFMSKPKLIQVPAVGTYGYVAMEVWTDDTVSDKTDVYSFGMVLLEVVCGRKYLMEPIETEFLEKPLEEKIDEIIEGSIAPECWQVFADITLRCVKLEPDERPTMGEVEVELEYALSLQKQADRAKYPLFSTTIIPPPPPSPYSGFLGPENTT